MNIYIASYSGTDIAHVNAVDDLHQCVMTTVDTWLQAGLTVTLRRDTPVVAAPTVAPKPVIAPKPAPKKAPKAPSKAAKTEWRQGATVYLCWSQLPLDPKTHLSAYRHAKGIVETFRGGPGVTKTVGVRFGGDPELTWLRPTELTATPEVDL